MTFHVCFHTFVQTVDQTGDSINEKQDVSYKFWRSFNLTFTANLFNELLMHPQNNLFFGFFSELSLENLVSPFQFFVVLSAHNSFPLQRFRFPLQKSAFWNFFSLPASSKKGSRFNQRTKMVLQQTENQFVRTTTVSTVPKATLQCVLASFFKVSIHGNFFSLYLAAFSRE